MKNKIDKLVNSPILLSEKDVNVFVKLMNFGENELKILKETRKIIKKYYLSEPLTKEDLKILDQTLILLNKKERDNSKHISNDQDRSVSNTVTVKKTHIEHLLDFYENHIYSLFIVTSPIHQLLLYFYKNNLDNIKDNNNAEELIFYIKNLSDKYQLEEIITTQENNFLHLLKKTFHLTRDDLNKILNNSLGNLFNLNQNTCTQLEQNIKGYRNILLPKINETYQLSQQLANFFIQTEEGTGSMLNKFIKGGTLGMAGAALLGPLGAIIAAGALMFSEDETETKKSKMLDNLYNNWTKAANSLYSDQLKLYYEKYDLLAKKIATQYKIHLIHSYKYAEKINKQSELFEYLKNEKNSVENNPKIMEVIEEARSVREFFQ